MITRDNYEEYFLLLADNELPEEEAVAVKRYAAQHPDLQEELDILLSCRLDALDMPHFPKEKLLRTTVWNEAQPEPLHTRMLLLLDNELPAAEKKELQQEIAGSTALQAEWNMLQQTRLVVEAITHPNKEILYRREQKVRPLLWMRWAAAAAVITAMGWLFWMNEAVQPSGTQLIEAGVQNTQKKEQAVVNKVPPVQASSHTKVSTELPENNNSGTMVAATTILPRKHPTHPVVVVATIPDNARTGTTIGRARPTVATEDYTGTATAPNSTAPSAYTAMAHLTSQTAPLVAENNTAALTTAIPAASLLPAIGSMQKSNAFTGSKMVMNTNEDEEEYIGIGATRIKKQKVRGIFRSVSRTVSRSFSKSKMQADVSSSIN